MGAASAIHIRGLMNTQINEATNNALLCSAPFDFRIVRPTMFTIQGKYRKTVQRGKKKGA